MWAVSFFVLIEIFLSVYNEFLLINDDLSHRCGWEWLQRCEPRAVGVPWPTCGWGLSPYTRSWLNIKWLKWKCRDKRLLFPGYRRTQDLLPKAFTPFSHSSFLSNLGRFLQLPLIIISFNVLFIIAWWWLLLKLCLFDVLLTNYPGFINLATSFIMSSSMTHNSYSAQFLLLHWVTSYTLSPAPSLLISHA